jgi:hypothetical protein
MPKGKSMLDMVELLWRMKRDIPISQHKKRSLLGLLWTNRSTKQTKLLYSLAKILQVDFIPQRLETIYGIKHADAWIEWMEKEEDVEQRPIPTVECPIWKEVIKPPVSFAILPSATRPRLMRWGHPSHGLLWKRESGSVDRIIEYSISLCSEGLKESGILQHS